ncbi:L,D-transpeptidase family protein [Miniphocaeibacter massiliensis]|uniref:L,D-transpeptidase family protein n=1 Tax=Miniphocaeibacter massiliensis TaxID=2041841 RepID=UPI000C1C7428|nr:L,D-transpeptidase family protein [Miniphocaeibacter massiliensis]
MKKKASIIIISIVAVIYLIGVAIFSFYTFPRTEVNNSNRGFTSKSKILNSDYSDYSLDIMGKDDKKDTIYAKDIEYKVSIPENTKIKQNAFLWPIEIFRNHKHNIEYNPSWDDNALNTIIENSKLNKEAKEPVDAKIERVNDKFEITPEVEGNKIDVALVKESVVKAFSENKEELVLKDEYLKPKVLADTPEMKERLELMNSLFNVAITFDFDYTKEDLQGEALIALYDQENGDYKLNKDKVTAYVKQLASKYDTFGKEHQFNATGLGEITVPGGIYGWQTDVQKTTDLLLKQIETKESGTIKPEYKLKGLTRVEKGVGDTYVEIDLTRQHMWFYKEGKLVVETDIISGRPGDRETPTGTFKVWSRETNRRLNGENYSSPVNFWLPINWGGIGLHDASWQSNFGGEIYKSRGSHGCINTPYDNVKKIYDEVKIDTPVLVYKS